MLSRIGLWRQITRAQAEAAYGSRCEICGETGDLAFELNKMPNGKKYTLASLRICGYPKGAAHLLCMNCKRYMNAQMVGIEEMKIKFEDEEFATEMRAASRSRAIIKQMMVDGLEKRRDIEDRLIKMMNIKEEENV